MVDELGEDKAIDHMIGTGPYEATKWTAHDRVDLEAVPNHWRVVPKNERFSVVEIGEPLAMQAAFLTGEVDIVGLPNSLSKDTLARTPGATFKPIGRPDTQMFSVRFRTPWHALLGQAVSPEQWSITKR